MKEHTEALKRIAGRLPAYLRLTWALAREPRLSRYAKTLLAAGAVYTVSPIDLVPGFIPIIGQLDDLLILLYALRAALNRLPPDARQSHLASHNLTPEQLEADTAAVQAALGAAAQGAARLAGRAVAWGARTAARGLVLGAQGAAAAGRGALGLWRRRRGDKPRT